ISAGQRCKGWETRRPESPDAREEATSRVDRYVQIDACPKKRFTPGKKITHRRASRLNALEKNKCSTDGKPALIIVLPQVHRTRARANHELASTTYFPVPVLATLHSRNRSCRIPGFRSGRASLARGAKQEKTRHSLSLPGRSMRLFLG